MKRGKEKVEEKERGAGEVKKHQKREQKEKAHMGSGREDSRAKPPSLPVTHVYPDPNRRNHEGKYLSIS